MKRFLSIAAMLSLVILCTSAISIGEMPQDPPRSKKAQKHIKIVKVGEDGKKMKLDTIIEEENVFVLNGDTIVSGKGFAWHSDEDFDFDMDMDFDVKQNGKGNVVVLRSGKGADHKVYEFKTDEGDSLKQVRVKVLGGNHDMDFTAPHAAHKMMFFNDSKKGNIIDLSDPGIISYDKKDLKGGKEKIVIVREKPSESSDEINEEVIIHGGAPKFFHEDGKHRAKQIKVITNDDGAIEILEDGKVWNIDENDKDVQIIEEDGKKITIKRIKKGDELKVDVEVEEEVEEKK